jgi:MvaI/BcnI restriction endonuclease family protein
MSPNELNLDRLKQLMRASGVTQLYLKRLAENDNSKNQVYLGPDFTALNVLPTGELIGDAEKPNLLKAAVNFSWLTSTGEIAVAPHAQLILYPQYPEVRFSGFLRGCRSAPNDVMTVRQAGRYLFFGITAAGHVLGFATSQDSALARETDALSLRPDTGVFSQIAIEDRVDDRAVLVAELARISALEWIDSKRLNNKGEILDCNAPNCGGYTLEAELGIRPNGISDPDFHGWEIKQHAVTNLMRPASGGPITLMTPEPTGGVYVEEGVKEFIRRYGYPDRTIADRRNFGGIHNSLRICTATNLALTLQGYDPATRKITDFSGGISLVDPQGTAAAVWHYKDLLSHWTRKHAKAAYIPSIVRKEPRNQYQYSSHVRLAEGTEFRLFLNAVASGDVYYDPGIKIVNVSSAKPEVKKRSQFRIRSASIPLLYTAVTEVDVAT